MSTNNIVEAIKWYKKAGMTASKAQVLLAAEFISAYKYPVNIACCLALESYGSQERQNKCQQT